LWEECAPGNVLKQIAYITNPVYNNMTALFLYYYKTNVTDLMMNKNKNVTPI